MPDNTLNIATFFLDDDPDEIALIKSAIDKAGIRNYHLFTDEDEFLKGLNDDMHICVVDHTLTKRTGLDILEEVKRKNEGSFFIVYTVADNRDTIIDYLDAGADKFIDKNKPDHKDKLTSCLKMGYKVGKKRIDYVAYLRDKAEKLTDNE